MENEFEEALESIGLTKTEADIYVYLLKCGAKCPALKVSKDSGVHRSNTYDALYSLAKKGFLSETIENNRTVFTAISPEKLKVYAKNKETEFERFVDRLEVNNVPAFNDGISVVYGLFSLRASLQSLLSSGDEILGFGLSKKALEVLGEGFLKEFHKERAKRKTEFRFIYNKEISEDIKKMKHLPGDAKFFPKGYSFDSSVFISGDVILSVTYSPCFTIIIKNKELARTYESYFNLFWDIAKR